MTEAPLPRLEFRWRNKAETVAEQARADLNGYGSVYFCDYGLVLPLGEGDIRRENTDDDTIQSEIFYKFSTTICGFTQEPDDGRIPYRDGAHSVWDSEALNNLPIWVRSFSGHHAEVKRLKS